MIEPVRRTLAPGLLVLLIACVIGACAQAPRPVLEGATPPESWDALMAAAQPIVWRTIESGSLEVKRQDIIDEAGDGRPEAGKRTERTPVRSLVLTLPDGSVWLVDAGLSKAFSASPTGSLGGLLAGLIIRGAAQSPGASVAERLAAEGLKPTGVLLTHLHFDHINGIRDLGADVAVLCGPGETVQDYPLLFSDDSLRAAGDVREIGFARGRELPPLGVVADVFGTGAVYAVKTPGHSAGSLSYLFFDHEGPVLFVGDAATAAGLARGVGPGDFSADKVRGAASAQAIKAFADRYPTLRVVFAHEVAGE